MAFSIDLKQLAYTHYQNGVSNSVIYAYLGKRVSLRSIQRWCLEFQATGKATVKKSPGRPNISKTKLQVIQGKMKYRTNRVAKVSDVIKVLQVPRTSLRRALKSADLKAYHKRRIPLLTNDHIKQRVTCTRNFRKEKYCHYEGLDWMFSDEKKFTQDGGFNRQNDVVYAVSRAEADKTGGLHSVKKYPISVMVWVGLTKYGPTKPYFIDDRVNSNYYTRKIMPHAKREGKRLFGTEKYIYQQDGATCHTSKKSSGWCRRNLYKYVKKQDWPANSPDLNPLDYYFWSAVIKKMPKKRFETKEELIEAIEIAMNKVSIQECEKAVNSFWARCRTVENANGAYCLK